MTASPIRTAPRHNPNAYNHYVVGISIGEASEPTAVAVVEQHIVKASGWGSECESMALRDRKRLDLNTGHVDLVQWLMRTVLPGLDKLDHAGGAELVVDVNATGRAVAELMEKRGLNPVRVAITAAAGEDRDPKNFNSWRVGRPDMVGILQLALESGRLDAAHSLDLLPALGQELQDFKLRAPSIKETDLGSRDSLYSDLVFAVGLAVWRAEREIPLPRSIQDEWTRKLNDPARFKGIT